MNIQFKLPCKRLPRNLKEMSRKEEALLQALKDAFAMEPLKVMREAELRPFGDIFVTCRDDQFASFIMLRSKYGAENWVAELDARYTADKSQTPRTYWDVTNANMRPECRPMTTPEEYGVRSWRISAFANKINFQDTNGCALNGQYPDYISGDTVVDYKVTDEGHYFNPNSFNERCVQSVRAQADHALTAARNEGIEAVAKLFDKFAQRAEHRAAEYQGLGNYRHAHGFRNASSKHRLTARMVRRAKQKGDI